MVQLSLKLKHLAADFSLCVLVVFFDFLLFWHIHANFPCFKNSRYLIYLVMYIELQCTNIPVLLNFKHWLFWIEVCLKGTYNYQYSLNDTGFPNILGFFFSLLFKNNYSIVYLQVINNVIGDGKVSLGKTWSHVPHCRLLISHPKDQGSNVRELVLIKSSRLVNKNIFGFIFMNA